MIMYILLLIISIIFISIGLTFFIVSLNYLSCINNIFILFNFIIKEFIFWMLPIGILILLICIYMRKKYKLEL